MNPVRVAHTCYSRGFKVPCGHRLASIQIEIVTVDAVIVTELGVQLIASLGQLDNLHVEAVLVNLSTGCPELTHTVIVLEPKARLNLIEVESATLVGRTLPSQGDVCACMEVAPSSAAAKSKSFFVISVSY